MKQLNESINQKMQKTMTEMLNKLFDALSETINKEVNQMEQLDKFINKKITGINGYVGSNSVELVFENGSIALKGNEKDEVASQIKINGVSAVEGLKLHACYYSFLSQEYVFLLENGGRLEVGFAIIKPIKPILEIKE